jgi:hypothetical protein
MYVMNLFRTLLGSTVVDVEAAAPDALEDEAATTGSTENGNAAPAIAPSDDDSIDWPQWADDRLGYWPVHDRGGAMSEYAGAGDRGMLGVLARIELNEEDGRKLEAGLPEHPLQPRD